VLTRFEKSRKRMLRQKNLAPEIRAKLKLLTRLNEVIEAAGEAGISRYDLGHHCAQTKSRAEFDEALAELVEQRAIFRGIVSTRNGQVSAQERWFSTDWI
jgi:hypothetical protein